MLGSNMKAGLDAGLNQTSCGAGSVLGPDFGEILTSLVPICLKPAKLGVFKVMNVIKMFHSNTGMS